MLHPVLPRRREEYFRERVWRSGSISFFSRLPHLYFMQFGGRFLSFLACAHELLKTLVVIPALLLDGFHPKTRQRSENSPARRNKGRDSEENVGVELESDYHFASVISSNAPAHGALSDRGWRLTRYVQPTLPDAGQPWCRWPSEHRCRTSLNGCSSCCGRYQQSVLALHPVRNYPSSLAGCSPRAGPDGIPKTPASENWSG